jgi:hypothetical protein
MSIRPGNWQLLSRGQFPEYWHLLLRFDLDIYGNPNQQSVSGTLQIDV